jgi:hypothetical protein
MGVIHAAWGFDGDNDEHGVYVRPEEDCPRCKTLGSVFGEEALRVLLGREVQKLRRSKEIPLRRMALDSGMDPDDWSALEKGAAAMEVITAARQAVERIAYEPSQS